MDVIFWQFSKNSPNFAYVADAMTFIIMLHSTCIGLFLGAFLVLVCWILVLLRNNHLLCIGPLLLRCRMHLNICGESFCFLCILLLTCSAKKCDSLVVKVDNFYHFRGLIFLMQNTFNLINIKKQGNSCTFQKVFYSTILYFFI